MKNSVSNSGTKQNRLKKDLGLNNSVSLSSFEKVGT